MTRLLAVLAFAALGAASAAGQELSAPGLAEGLDSISAAARAQKAEARRRSKDDHRIGHSSAPVETAGVPDVSGYPVRGVDVSHYEGAIDWGRVKAAGAAFAFLKATEGGDYVDDTFAANWSSAAAAGMPRGAYHFYDFCATGAAQADNFIRTVPFDDGALPPVIDLEQSNDCAKMPTKKAFLKQFDVFVRKIRAAYGRAPILYVNLGIYDSYLTEVGPAFPLWIADPSHASPVLPAGARWAFWQYSWHGKVDGIGVETDLDVFAGDAAALSALTRP